VLSVLLFATPAWNTLLTKAESAKIESVLRTGLHLVYDDRYTSFDWPLKEANMSSLEDQRKKAFRTFTLACIKSNKFKNWFMEHDEEEQIPGRQSPGSNRSIPEQVHLQGQRFHKWSGWQTV
jgi:hypothetical protein